MRRRVAPRIYRGFGRTDSDVSFHTPTGVSNTVLGNDVTQLNSAVARPVRNISIPLIRGDYTPMQAKVQPFRPTHLYKATYGILEPMVFVVFMNTAKTFAIARDKHGHLLECATKCLIPFNPDLEGTPYDLQDDTHLTLADQLQGSPASRAGTPVAAVARQVSYLPAATVRPQNNLTTSQTAARSPSAVSDSARTMLKQRQVSFSSDADGLDTPSSTSLSIASGNISQSTSRRNLPAGIDISNEANSLTAALNSIATVNQAVVQTLRELKTGKSSSSTTRFPIDKILQYEGKCQLGDCYTSRPAAWCNHFRDKALAYQLDDKLWTVFALLASAPVVSHRWRDEMERPAHASPTWQIWDKDEEFGHNNSEAARTTFPKYARWLCDTYKDDHLFFQQKNVFDHCFQKSGERTIDFNRRWLDQKRLVDELAGEFLYDASSRHTELLLNLYLSHLHPDIASSVRAFKLQSQMTVKMQAQIAPQSSDTPAMTLHHLQEYAVDVKAQMAAARTMRSSYSPVTNSRSTTPWRGVSRSQPPRLLTALTDAEDTHSLYARLHQEGRVSWSPHQLKLLFSENRCFKCSQTGHTAKDCPNAAVDPKTVRFHHLAIDDGQDTGAQEILDDDAHMSDLLLELADSLN